MPRKKSNEKKRQEQKLLNYFAVDEVSPGYIPDTIYDPTTNIFYDIPNRYYY